MTTENVRVRRGEVKLNASRIAGYAAAAAAGAVAGTANASITYSGPLNIPVVNTGIDIFFGAAPAHLGLFHQSLGSGYGAAIEHPNAGGTPGVEVAGFAAGNYNYATNVAAGAAISALPTFLGSNVTGTLAFASGFANSQFVDAGDAFLGVRFNTNQYGWVHLRMDASPLNSFTIVDFAFAGPGEAIHAGEVPGPGSLAALALGALGLKGWRRRSVAA
jgi:hypothetical protein